MTAPYIDDPRWKVRPELFEADTLDLSALAAAVLPQHPIGINARQDIDFAKLLAYVQQQGGLRSLLLHVDKGALPNAKQFLPHVGVLIWRNRAFQGEKLRLLAPNPERFIDDRIAEIRAAGMTPEQVWIHLHNESEWNAELIEWERRATQHAIAKGARVIVLNPGVGTPEPEQIALARPLIELAGQFPDQVIIGLHEYFSVYGWRKERWYLARWKEWEVYRTAQKLSPVRYLITEFGTEDIANDHSYTNTLPRTDSREFVGPVHANEAAWSATYNSDHNSSSKDYPGKDIAYFEQIESAYSIGHYAEACIEAVLLFSWGGDGGRWDDYDVQAMTVLHGLLASWDKRGKEPFVPTVPPVEIALKPAYDALLAESTNLRTEPTPDNRKSKVTGTVKVEPGKDTLVRVQEPVEPVTNDSDNGQFIVYSWFRVTATLPLFAEPVTGWMAKHRADLFKRIDPESVPEPEPDPPPPPPDDEPVYATKEYVDQKAEDQTEYTAAKFEALMARIDTLQARVDGYERILRAHHLSIETELKIAG